MNFASSSAQFLLQNLKPLRVLMVHLALLIMWSTIPSIPSRHHFIIPTISSEASPRQAEMGSKNEYLRWQRIHIDDVPGQSLTLMLSGKGFAKLLAEMVGLNGK